MDILLSVLVLLIAFFPFICMVYASIKMRQNYLEIQALSNDTDLDLTKTS